MLAILAPILVFGLVIFVHELGHFLAAKATGVYAPRFSIGFGPALFRKRRGETEYILAALPLGGYVRMASRHDEEAAFMEGGSEEKTAKTPQDKGYDPNAMIPFGPKPVPENRWFESKPLPARLFIMIAGVVMNVLLALVVSTALAYHFGRVVVPTTVIGAVHADSVPALAQLHGGDTIRAVNGQAVTTWNDVRRQIGDGASGDVLVFTTQRGEAKIPLQKGMASAQQVADGLVYFLPAVMDSILPGGAAEKAGLRRGDSVVAVGPTPVRAWTDMVDVVTKSPNQPLAFAIQRGRERQVFTVTPRATPDTDATGAVKTVGKIGAAARDLARHETVGPVEAIASGARLTWVMAGSVVGFLHDLFVGKVSVSQLGGPVAITKASISAARSGIEELFYLIALLSINVAILNLFPIPILDGGQIVINVLESAKGSPFSMKTREYILRFGLLAIGLLFLLVMYNDLGFGKLVGWVGKLFG